MSNSSNMSNETSNTFPDLVFSYFLRFWLYLISNILSILCSIFVLYHFLFNRTLRQSINNHAIIILVIVGLISELTDILWICYYYYFHYTWQQTPSFVLIWILIDYASYVIQIIIFAWATIERYILVFYEKWLRTKKQRIYLHYIPLIVILVYGLTYYSIIFFATTCQNHFDYTVIYGLSVPCIFLANPIISKWNLIFNLIIPCFVIIIFSLSLLLRFILQKRRLHRTINWRKQRKMIIQLLSISMIYFIFNAPYALVYLAFRLGLSTEIGVEFSLYAGFFSYYITFFLPFIACGTLPELEKRIKKLFCCHKQRQLVHPAN